MISQSNKTKNKTGTLYMASGTVGRRDATLLTPQRAASPHAQARPSLSANPITSTPFISMTYADHSRAYPAC